MDKDLGTAIFLASIVAWCYYVVIKYPMDPYKDKNNEQ